MIFIYNGAPAHNNPAIPGSNSEHNTTIQPVSEHRRASSKYLKSSHKVDISRPEQQEQMNNRAEARRQGIALGNCRTQLLHQALQRNKDTITAAKCGQWYRFMQTYIPRCLNKEEIEGKLQNITLQYTLIEQFWNFFFRVSRVCVERRCHSNVNLLVGWKIEWDLFNSSTINIALENEQNKCTPNLPHLRFASLPTYGSVAQLVVAPWEEMGSNLLGALNFFLGSFLQLLKLLLSCKDHCFPWPQKESGKNTYQN